MLRMAVLCVPLVYLFPAFWSETWDCQWTDAIGPERRRGTCLAGALQPHRNPDNLLGTSAGALGDISDVP